MRARQRGSITLEMVLAIPVVFMLIWGGTVLAIAAQARASLQMTAMRAARELAASDAASRIPKKDELYAYEEFTETYSLYRPKVEMLVVNHGGIIVAGACYRVRLDMPSLGKPSSPIPAPLQPVEKRIVPADLLPDAERLAQDAVATWDDSKEVWQHVTGVWNKLSGFRFPTPHRDEFTRTDIQFHDLAQFDAEVRKRCGSRNLLLAEHAAFWSEKTEEPDKEKTDEEKKKEPSVILTLNPTEVTIPANAGPEQMPEVTATATVVPPDADCTIWVEYSSGRSQADGLKQPSNVTKTTENVVFQWTWKVGTETKSGDWPVTVRCTNYKHDTVKLKVTGK